MSRHAGECIRVYQKTWGTLASWPVLCVTFVYLVVSPLHGFSGSQSALEHVGLWDTFKSAQLDRCIWNYQTDSSCRKDLDCRHVPCRDLSNLHSCQLLLLTNEHDVSETYWYIPLVYTVLSFPLFLYKRQFDLLIVLFPCHSLVAPLRPSFCLVKSGY